jgi:colanic acid/amylovoran biosynthesis protein
MLGQLGWVTEPDVCGVVDLSGFVYGAQWGDYSMRRAAAEIKRFGKSKRPYVFLPQAFGPFENTRGASEFGAALSRAALIYARDHRSKANLDALMPAGAPSVSVMPDMTMAASSDFALANRLSIDAKTAVVVPNSRVVSQGVADESRYIQFLVASAERLLADGYRVVLVNHAGREDAWLTLQLARLLSARGREVECVAETDPYLIRGVIGAAGVVVASRFHACVAALAQGVPCIATSWNHKYQELFSLFDCADGVLIRLEESDFQRALEFYRHQRADLSHVAQAVVSEAMRQIDGMWRSVTAVFDSAR